MKSSRHTLLSRYLNTYCHESEQIQFFEEKTNCRLIPFETYVTKYLTTHMMTMDHDQKIIHLKKITVSIVHAFTNAYWNFGVCLQLNPKNTFLELSVNDEVTGRVFYKDLEGARIDTKKVSALGFEIHPEFSEEQTYVEALKEKIKPQLKDSLVWNGLTTYGFKMFVVDSSIQLLEQKSGMELTEYANKYLSRKILTKCSDTFLKIYE